jgi:uncharacterized protein with beta-barrel porin domain
MFKLNFRRVNFYSSRLLALFTFTILLVTGLTNQAKAADISATIETGGAVAGNAGTVDTFVIDVTNDGNANATITLGTGNAGLTVSSDGADADDTGQFTSLTSTDDTGTATFTLNDATNGDNLTLTVSGNISGDVATDANDLNVIVNATNTDDAGDSNLQVGGDITLGSGTVTLNSDADDIATLTLNGAGAQAISGVINGASAGEGTVTNSNTGGTVTFNSAIGSTTVNTVTLAANSTTIFSGAVSTSNQINLNTTNTTTFSGSVVTTTLNFGANGTATVADNANITAAVTTSTGNTGTLNFSGTSTMTGDIAASGTVLAAVNINGSSETVTLTGDLNATTTTIANLATLTFTKAATTVTGVLTAAGTTGTINVGTATVTPSGAVTLGANSTLAVTIGTTNGQLVSTASTGLALASGTTIAPTVSGTLAAGDITIVQNNDNDVGLGAGVTTGITITDNSSQFNFTLKFTGNNLVLTVVDTGSSAGLSTNSAAINNVTTAAFASDTTLSNALNALSGSPRDEALKTLAPVVDGGGVAGAFSAGGATSSSVSTRTASLRTGISAGQGLNAGDEITEEKHFWFQGFGTYADQGTRQGVTGFTSVTGGFAMGADKQVSHDLVLGLAGSFAYSDVNTSLSQNRTTVNSYQATVYGSYDYGKYFIDAQVGLAYNGYSGHRFINVGSVGRTAVSDYSGYQVSGLVEVGREMSLPKKVKFTPIVGLGYTHVGIPEYSETGAGSSNLNVNGQDYDILNTSFRGEFRRTYEMAMGSLTPEVMIGYNYEAFNNNIQNISSFSGGGAAFETVGFDPENHSFLAGAGVAFESMENFDFVASYDLVSKTDYKSHSFLLKGRWSF